MPFNRIRGNRWRRITPLMRRRQAPQRGTAELEFSSGQTANVHLSALKFSPAKNTVSLVVEGFPTPERISCAQDRQPIIELKMNDHCNEQSAHHTETHNRSAG